VLNCWEKEKKKPVKYRTPLLMLKPCIDGSTRAAGTMGVIANFLERRLDGHDPRGVYGASETGVVEPPFRNVHLQNPDRKAADSLTGNT
jgi:hypothetical protein